MKIEVVKKIIPMPKKTMQYRGTCEAEMNRFDAVRALARIEVGMHVKFSGVERSRIYNYIRSPDLDGKSFAVCLLDPFNASVFGVWRTF